MNDFFAGNLDALTKKLAYENWERRGRPFGSPEIDWNAAEKALAPSPGCPEADIFLSSFSLEPNEAPYR
jgi:Protein of unknown function (DUF2934)